MRLTIGVMGSSGGDVSEAVLAKAYRLGETIAARDAVLVTGGCPGLPYAAVRGAKANAGLVIGISRGLSLDEHRGKYGSPVEGFDVLVYTGSGLMGCEITSIRSCDMVIIVGGQTGTLGELAIASGWIRLASNSPSTENAARVGHPEVLLDISMRRQQRLCDRIPTALGRPDPRMAERHAASLALVPRRVRRLESGAVQIRDEGVRP